MMQTVCSTLPVNVFAWNNDIIKHLRITNAFDMLCFLSQEGYCYVTECVSVCTSCISYPSTCILLLTWISRKNVEKVNEVKC
jgi:hypothetical protein